MFRWRRPEEVLKTFFVFVFRRRLQDVLVKTNIFPLVIRLQRTFSKRLQKVFKTSSRRVAKMSSKHLRDVFKTSCQNVLKAPSKRVQDVLQRCLYDILKTFSRRIIKLNCSCSTVLRLRDVFNTFSRFNAKTIIHRKICLGETSEKFMVRVQNFQEWTLWIHRDYEKTSKRRYYC